MQGLTMNRYLSSQNQHISDSLRIFDPKKSLAEHEAKIVQAILSICNYPFYYYGFIVEWVDKSLLYTLHDKIDFPQACLHPLAEDQFPTNEAGNGLARSIYSQLRFFLIKFHYREYLDLAYQNQLGSYLKTLRWNTLIVLYDDSIGNLFSSGITTLFSIQTRHFDRYEYVAKHD